MIHAITDIEAPSDAPVDVRAESVGSQAVRVMWRPGYSSFRSDRNAHLIQGYYVGFRAAHSQSVFSYKTVETSGGSSTGSSEESGAVMMRNQYETVITNLERLSKYVIVVKSFNRKGSGPASEEVYVTTNDVGKNPDCHPLHRQTFLFRPKV